MGAKDRSSVPRAGRWHTEGKGRLPAVMRVRATHCCDVLVQGKPTVMNTSEATDSLTLWRMPCMEEECRKFITPSRGPQGAATESSGAGATGSGQGASQHAGQGAATSSAAVPGPALLRPPWLAPRGQLASCFLEDSQGRPGPPADLLGAQGV